MWPYLEDVGADLVCISALFKRAHAIRVGLFREMSLGKRLNQASLKSLQLSYYLIGDNHARQRFLRFVSPFSNGNSSASTA